MKLSKLVDPTFQTALRKLASQDVPLKTAFKLKGMIKQVNESLVRYEEVRTDALKRYGDKDDNGELIVDDGRSVKLTEDNSKLFVKELSDLLEADVEIGKLKVSDLGDKISLTTNELLLLEEIVQD